GRRFDSLQALAKAASIRPSLELRNEAIDCLALPDLRIAKEWNGHPPGTTMLTFDETFTHYTRSDTNGEISVRRVEDDQEIAQLPASGKAAWLLRFSPNGEFLAARYDTGHLNVWDWRVAKTVFRA